jgi:single-strand DNA-binding protein
VQILGRLGKDAETSFTPGGSAVSKFSVATTRQWKDKTTNEFKEETNWTNCVLWGQEKLGPYLQKGKQVYVEGRLQTRSYEKDGKKVYVTEAVADEVILLGGQEGGSQYAQPASRPAAAAAGSARSKAAPADDFAEMEITDADIPW